jgi:DNA-directed RNA polymerase specialized sigma24 family protein
LKQEDIARELGLSTNTVKNHLKAALRSVRRFLAGQAYIVAAAIAAHLLRP